MEKAQGWILDVYQKNKKKKNKKNALSPLSPKSVSFSRKKPGLPCCSALPSAGPWGTDLNE